jgi:hypothetical protein
MEPSDISSSELTEIVNKFNEDSGIPEQSPRSINLDHWLSNEYNIENVIVKELEGGLNGYGIILENLLTRRECQKIIEETEAIGYGHLGTGSTGTAYRGILVLFFLLNFLMDQETRDFSLTRLEES